MTETWCNMIFGSFDGHHMTLDSIINSTIAFSIVPLYSLSQDIWRQDANSVINGATHLLGQDDQKIHNMTFGHVRPLASAFCDVNGITNDTTVLFNQDKKNKLQHHFFHHMMQLVLAMASCNDDGYVNTITLFISLRWSK